jgi:hypothetical protein
MLWFDLVRLVIHDSRFTQATAVHFALCISYIALLSMGVAHRYILPPLQGLYQTCFGSIWKGC